MRWHEAAAKGFITKWRLENHTVREYATRLAIARLDGERLTWEEIQKIKNQIWGPEVFAIEIYPAEDKVVNLRHTRHIWRLPALIELEVRGICTHEEFTTEGD